MKKILFNQAQFITSAIAESGFPLLRHSSGSLFPEIAIIGRSNVGKSSLINHLLNHRKLAKVSSTPGKTQLLNFFSVDDQLALVDLPGYGYAKVSKEIREKWDKVIDAYLNNRTALSLILLLLDIRREPQQEDLAFIEWCLYHNKKMILIFTKADKVSKNEMSIQLKRYFEVLNPLYGKKAPPYVHYSIKDPSSRPQLIETIHQSLNTES